MMAMDTVQVALDYLGPNVTLAGGNDKNWLQLWAGIDGCGRTEEQGLTVGKYWETWLVA